MSYSRRKLIRELSATQLGARPTSPVKSSQSAKCTVTFRRLGIDRNPDAPPGRRKDTLNTGHGVCRMPRVSQESVAGKYHEILFRF